MPETIMVLLLIIGIVFLAILYFIPTGIAFMRRHRNRVAIAVLNLFLGWSMAGWVVALVWAFTANTENQNCNTF